MSLHTSEDIQYLLQTDFLQLTLQSIFPAVDARSIPIDTFGKDGMVVPAHLAASNEASTDMASVIAALIGPETLKKVRLERTTRAFPNFEHNRA